MRAASCSSTGTASACSSCFRSGCVSSLVSIGISSEIAINRRLRSIRRPAMYSSLRSTISLALVLVQLALPVEDAGLRALGLRLRDAARRLVEAREARVREGVVGRELAEALARFDRLVVAPELAERHGEPVPRVRELRIERDRLAVDRDRLLRLAFAEQVDGAVVELVLRGHARSVAQPARYRQVAR